MGDFQQRKPASGRNDQATRLLVNHALNSEYIRTMNHSLSVYTVIYLAILFVTVSIWGSGLSSAGGDGRVLLAAQGAFALKLAIDDYIHFQGELKNRLHTDLSLSLLLYVLLAVSLAGTATKREHLATLSFAGVFAVGFAWILSTGLGSDDGGKRRRIWAKINAVAILLLGWACWHAPSFHEYTMASIPLSVLLGLILADFLWVGSLKRLAHLASQNSTVVADTGGPDQTTRNTSHMADSDNESRSG